MKKKALVTGGAGFIGSHLAERLLAENWHVTVLDDLSNGFESNIPAGADFVRGSMGNADLLASVLPGHDVIFHLAAVASVIDSIERPIEVHHTNLTDTLILLEAAVRHRIRRFVFSSSAAVYGDAGQGAITEETPKDTLSHYAAQKLASEFYCRVYRQLYGLETVCLRYFNVYGPRQRADSPYTGVITKFLTSAQEGRPLTIFGDGSQSRDFVAVTDVAAANFAAAIANISGPPDPTFNIGTGQSTTVLNLANIIRHHFPNLPPHNHQPPRAGEILYSLADITRAGKVLEFKPRGSLEAFLADGR